MTLRNAGLLFLAFIVQSTIAPSMAIQTARPDFLLITLAYVALSQGAMAGTLFGCVFGLLQDFYSPGTNLGLNALCKSLVGYIVGFGKEGLFKDNILILVITLLITALFHDGLYFLVYSRHDLSRYGPMMLHDSLPSIGYTVVVGTVLALCAAFRRGTFDARRIFRE